MQPDTQHPHGHFRLEEHPELRKDFFDLPAGFADEFPFALQQRLAQKPQRKGLLVGIAWVRLALPVALVGVLAVVLAANWLPQPSGQAFGETFAAAEALSYEEAVEEILLDPVLAETYLPDFAAPSTGDAQQTTEAALTTQLSAIPTAEALEFLENHLQDAVVYEFLEGAP